MPNTIDLASRSRIRTRILSGNTAPFSSPPVRALGFICDGALYAKERRKGTLHEVGRRAQRPGYRICFFSPAVDCRSVTAARACSARFCSQAHASKAPHLVHAVQAGASCAVAASEGRSMSPAFRCRQPAQHGTLSQNKATFTSLAERTQSQESDHGRRAARRRLPGGP